MRDSEKIKQIAQSAIVNISINRIFRWDIFLKLSLLWTIELENKAKKKIIKPPPNTHGLQKNKDLIYSYTK